MLAVVLEPSPRATIRGPLEEPSGVDAVRDVVGVARRARRRAVLGVRLGDETLRREGQEP